ncbi:hypothetical protein EZV73_05900 [Acidaminobacter sp. JC074]|uniref:SWIM zinc finger family protein n=1 Tax=Acidaminobacter sp. JC074 TaxID=2530199 RepID=UPI001F116E9A|nr:hypothetical protein [Acidaminobacter sp. JC074]MCH4887092.1 hypothetical protein [Acidaminobacter sp. JC074]
MKHESIFSSIILERGYDYYMNDRVNIINYNKSSLEANVSGYDLYHVYVKFDGQSIKYMKCTCPYYYDNHSCKHIVAALYEYENLPQRDYDLSLVDRLDEDDLRKYLKIILENNANLRESFMVKFASTLDIGPMISYIEKTFHKYDYIDDYTYDDFLEEIDQVQTYIKTLYDKGQHQDMLEVFKSFVNTLGNIDDHTSMSTPDNFYCILQVLEKESSIRSEILSYCYTVYKESLFYYSYEIKDWFINFLDEPVYNELFLKELEDELQHEIASGRYYSSTIFNRDSLYEKFGKSYQERLDALSTFEDNSLVYNRIIEMRLEEEDYHGLEAYIMNAPKNYYTFNYLKQYYLAIDDKDKLIQLYLDNLNVKISISYYQELKALYNDEQWQVGKTIIISMLSDWNQIDYVYSSENMITELLNYVLENKSFSALHKHQDQLKSDFNDILLDFYRIGEKKDITQLRSRGQYANYLSNFHKLFELEGGQDLFSELSSFWKSKYSTRKAFIDELNKFESMHI